MHSDLKSINQSNLSSISEEWGSLCGPVLWHQRLPPVEEGDLAEAAPRTVADQVPIPLLQWECYGPTGSLELIIVVGVPSPILFGAAQFGICLPIIPFAFLNVALLKGTKCIPVPVPSDRFWNLSVALDTTRAGGNQIHEYHPYKFLTEKHGWWGRTNATVCCETLPIFVNPNGANLLLCKTPPI